MLFKKRIPETQWEVPYFLPPAENIKKAAQDLRNDAIPPGVRAEMVVIDLSRTGNDLFPEFPEAFQPGTVTWMVGLRGSGISETTISACFRGIMNGMKVLWLCSFGMNEAKQLADRMRDVSQEGSNHAGEADLENHVFGPDTEPPLHNSMLFIHDGWEPFQDRENHEHERKRALERAIRSAPNFDLIILDLSSQGDPCIQKAHELANQGKTVILLSMEPLWAFGEMRDEDSVFVGRCLAPFYFGGKEIDATGLDVGEFFYKAPSGGWPRPMANGKPYKAPYLEFGKNAIMATSCRHAKTPVMNILSAPLNMTHSQALDRLARMVGYSSWMAASNKV